MHIHFESEKKGQQAQAQHDDGTNDLDCIQLGAASLIADTYCKQVGVVEGKGT